MSSRPRKVSVSSRWCKVVRPGKKLMVCLGEVFAEDGGKRKQVALMTASMMVMDTSPGLKD